MISNLCLVLGLFVPRATVADAGTATMASARNELTPDHKYRIHRSHTFHVAPRAIIDSVLSDVRRQPLTRNDDGVPSLDIDVSSTRLDDDALGAFAGGFLTSLNSNEHREYDSRSEAKAPLLIKLALAMNKITPSGASNLFELLINSGDVKNGTTNGTSIVGDGMAHEMVKAEEMRSDADLELSPNNDQDTTTENEESASFEGKIAKDGIQDSTTPFLVKQQSFLVEELDLSFNDIGGHGIHPPNVKLFESVRRLFEGGNSAYAPRILSLENCGIGPAFCRSIGRGMLNAFERQSNGANENVIIGHRPSVLRIGGNDAIGDAGTVALAAALRMAVGSGSFSRCIFDELDLSSCNVGDAGADALALALSSNPGSLRRLDLSNNKITNAGSKSLGRALVDSFRTSGVVLEQLSLDNNSGIGDDGAAGLAEALACGAVKSISLRSCSVRAQGTAAFGRALVSLANLKSCDESSQFCIDLSGNNFGIKKIKKKKGAMYSASVLRNKASTNIKSIGKSLRGAAKRFSSETMGISAESDDDEEVMDGLIDDEDEEETNDDKVQACGGRSFAGEILMSGQNSSSQTEGATLKISVGMRQCCLDDGAVDALSASIVGSNILELSFDVSMNSIDVAAMDALMKGERESKLAAMAQRHMDFLDRIADARQRQMEAADAAGARDYEFDGSYLDDDNGFFDPDSEYDPYDDFD